jgi:hypothetical protein
LSARVAFGSYTDGRELRWYNRSWIVDRFFAWIKHKHRLLNRWELHPENCLGFVHVFRGNFEMDSTQGASPNRVSSRSLPWFCCAVDMRFARMGFRFELPVS